MTLTPEVLIIAFIIGGVNLKLADFYERKSRGYIFAAISAVSMGLLISDSSTSSSIVLGIVLGVALAGKIDQPNLVMGLGLTLAIAIIMGFSIPDLPLIAVITGTVLIDEIGHDRITSGSTLANFFRFRSTLKTTIIILTILRQINIIHAVGFFCFDIPYDVTNFILTYKAKKV